MSAAKTPSQQGRASRAKGARGEREVCALLSELMGRTIQRRVRNADGDSDLMGGEPWVIEVKTYASAAPGQINIWWAQAVAQADKDGGWPLLVFKADRQAWRCVWPASLHRRTEPLNYRCDDTLTASPECWARLCNEL